MTTQPKVYISGRYIYIVQTDSQYPEYGWLLVGGSYTEPREWFDTPEEAIQNAQEVLERAAQQN